MPTTLSIMRVPSLALLRAFLKPTPPPCTQVRSKTNWMPREKYAKVTRLDKLHRKQKLALKQERLDSEARAAQMQPPSFIDKPPTATTTSTSTPTPMPSIPSPASASPRNIPHLPYAIARTSTPSRSLPIYESTKSGGSLHITTLRRCSGDLSLLQSHLLSALDLEESFLNKDGKKRQNVKINQATKQIIVRGWRGAEVRRWCEMVGF